MAEAGRSSVIKVELDGDIRRLRSWPAEGAAASLAGLREAVWDLFGTPAPVPHSFCLRVSDASEELTEETLAAFLASGAEGRPLRLSAVCPDMTLEQKGSEDCQEPALQCTDEPAAMGSDAGDADAISVAATNSEGTTTPERRRLKGLQKGLRNFGKSICSDFKSNRDEMGEAWASCRVPSEAQPKAVKAAKAVTSNVAGAVVAARLLPVRATQLAAESIQALKECPAAEASSPSSEAAGVVAQVDAAVAPEESGASGQTAGGPPAADTAAEEPVEHFTRQVTQDFKTVRKDVQNACRTFTQADRHRGSDNDPQPSRVTWREGVPAVVSFAAAVSVTSSLLTLRVARLAVAAACSQCGGSTQAAQGDVPQPSAPPQSFEAEQQEASEEELPDRAAGEEAVAASDGEAATAA
mmetsp:Transcript_29143/g.53182  ORF Transcript_29143/g.53182 Transcript_29143/m.53182 type:complete len:411 (+) Transcript_29143:79-1311(+)